MCLVVVGLGAVGGVVTFVVCQMFGMDQTSSILAGCVGGVVTAMIVGSLG